MTFLRLRANCQLQFMRSSQTEINCLVSKPFSQYWFLREERLLGLVGHWSDVEWGCYWDWVDFDRKHLCRSAGVLLSDGANEKWRRMLGNMQITFSKPPGKSSFACVPTLIFSMWATESFIFMSIMKKWNKIGSERVCYIILMLWYLLEIITCFRNLDRVIV